MAKSKSSAKPPLSLVNKKNARHKHHLVGSKKGRKHPNKTAANIAVTKKKKDIALFFNPPRPISVDQWTSIQTIGEKQVDLITTLHQQPWDFSHLQTVILALLDKNPDGALFVFGCQPHPYQNEDREAKFVPTLSVIHVPTAATEILPPPPILALQNPQQGIEVLVPMESFHLAWAPMKCFDDENSPAATDRVFVLQRTRATFTRRSGMKFEYATLFTMIPSQVCPRKDNGMIDLKSAKFAYTLPHDGEEIEECYTKGEDSFTDFCERYDLDVDQYKSEVKAAVKKGFDKEREKLESRLKKLKEETHDEYSESMLENIRVVGKIYPCNNELNNGLLVKSSYVNQYYGNAAEVF